jgi:hypothetical protein
MRSYKAFLFIALIFFFNLSAGAETITIENPAEIQYAHTLSQAIDRLTDKVMSCIDNEGGTIEQCKCTECSCKFTDEYAALKKAYNDALKAKPAWEDNIVFYRLEGDPT